MHCYVNIAYGILFGVVYCLYQRLRQCEKPHGCGKDNSSHTLFFLLTALFGELGGNKKLFIMGNISYHINEIKKSEAVTLEFDEKSMNDDLLKGKIALGVLESLKRQKILDVVIYTSDDNERVNLI